MRRVERFFDPLMWVWCAIAYGLVMTMPGRFGVLRHVWLWLLPFAGYYAYHVPGAKWRWSERVR